MPRKLKESIKNLFKKGFFHILFGSTATKVIAFISSIVIVRLVTKQEYAYYAYSVNLYSYINLFAGLGLSTALLKYASQETTIGSKKAYFIFALKIGTIFQLLLSLVLVISIRFINIPFSESKILIYGSVLLPPLVFIVATVQVFNRAQLRNRIFTKMALVQSILTFVLSIILVIMIGIFGAIIAQYIALIITIAYGLKFVFSDFKNKQKIVLHNKQIKQFVIFGLSLMIISFFSMIMQYNELFIVNNVLQNEISTANYKVAMMIPSQISILSGAVVIFYFPILSSIKDSYEIHKLSIKIGLINFGLITIIALLGFIFSPIIITIIYGQEYNDAIPLSRIFWIVYWINAGIRMVPMNVLPAIGIVKKNIIVSLFSAIIHILLSYYFITNYGLNGAAYAVGIIYFLSGIIYWIILLRSKPKVETNETIIE